MDPPAGPSSSSKGYSNKNRNPKKRETKQRMNFVNTTNTSSLQRLDEHMFPNSEFTSAPTQFTNSSYISFAQPVFTANVVIAQPTHFSPEVMLASQNFNTINRPVFTRSGYLYNGLYHSMAKKGTTRKRNKSLWRRGFTPLETIWEQPELEEEEDVQKEENKGGK